MKVENSSGEEPKYAVAYYRHSAEDKQENSVAIQREATQKFAEENHIKIIHEEADEGKSGLTANRPGFINLLKNWIENPRSQHFDYILVYDVSRWGRFQDQDEAAYYEFCCKKNGKQVAYVTRGLVKSGEEPIRQVLTSLERFMAAEYSRQLSSKVFHGCCYIAKQGYSSGGPPCYGFDRILLDETRQPVQILHPGQHKLISNQRVTFSPSNDQTTECVQKIFTWYVHECLAVTQIAQRLEEQGLLSPRGGAWNSTKIKRILRNEAYAGTLIYNKTWGRLKQKKRRNDKADWVICLNAFPAIISAEDFNKAQARLIQEKSAGERTGGTSTVPHALWVFHRWLRNNLGKAGWGDDEICRWMKNSTILYSKPFVIPNRAPRWCFHLPTKLNDRCLYLALSPDDLNENPIQFLCLLNSNDFGKTGLKVIDAEGDCEICLRLDDPKARERLLQF